MQAVRQRGTTTLPLSREAAKAIVAAVFNSNAWGAAEVDTEAADVVLDALGWPS